MARAKALGSNVFRRNVPLVKLYIYGNDLARDLQPLHKMMLYHFPKKAGVPITLGGATMFKRHVRQQMRPPRYPPAEGGGRKLAEPSSPSGGFGWYSGTLRRSLHARVASVGKRVVWSAMLPDHRKGHPPRWQRWGKPKNAYRYARWVELGEGPGPHSPVMLKGFNKGKRQVTAWMSAQTWAYFQKFASAGRAGRLARHARAGRVPAGKVKFGG